MNDKLNDYKVRQAGNVLQRTKLFLLNELDEIAETKKNLYKFNDFYTSTLDREATLQTVLAFIEKQERNLYYGYSKNSANKKQSSRITATVNSIFSKIDRL